MKLAALMLLGMCSAFTAGLGAGRHDWIFASIGLAGVVFWLAVASTLDTHDGCPPEIRR